jgi:hypothetical protein
VRTLEESSTTASLASVAYDNSTREKIETKIFVESVIGRDNINDDNNHGEQQNEQKLNSENSLEYKKTRNDSQDSQEQKVSSESDLDKYILAELDKPMEDKSHGKNA